MSGGSYSYNRFEEFEKKLTEGSCGTKGYQEGGEVKCEKDSCKHCEGKGCEKCEDKKDEKKEKGAKPDFLDMDKDGNKEEPMKKALKDAEGEAVSEEAMHRDAKTGEVVKKAEIGKTYYPAQPKKKTSVAKRKEEAAMKEAYAEMYRLGKPEGVEEGYKPHPHEANEKQAARHLAHARKAAKEGGDVQKHVDRAEKLKSPLKAKMALKKEEVELEEGLLGKKKEKSREEKLKELERLAKHANNPLSDVNTSKSMKKEDLEATGLFSAEEIEALVEKNEAVEKALADLKKKHGLMNRAEVKAHAEKVKKTPLTDEQKKAKKEADKKLFDRKYFDSARD